MLTGIGDMGALPKLRVLRWGFNRLRGPLPLGLQDSVLLANCAGGIGDAQNYKDDVLQVSRSGLSGTLPGSLSKMALLANFDLSSNNLNGGCMGPRRLSSTAWSGRSAHSLPPVALTLLQGLSSLLLP